MLPEFNAENTLFFDFQGKKINSIYVNDKKVENIEYDGLFINLPGSIFKLNS